MKVKQIIINYFLIHLDNILPKYSPHPHPPFFTNVNM